MGQNIVNGLIRNHISHENRMIHVLLLIRYTSWHPGQRPGHQTTYSGRSVALEAYHPKSRPSK